VSDGSVRIDSSIDSSKLDGQLKTIKRKFSTGFASIAKSGVVAFAAITAAVGAFSVSASKDLIAFEDQFNEVFTLLPGISQAAMDEMKGQAKDFAKEMGVLPEEVIPALYQALSAGVPPGNVFDFLRDAQKLARGGVAELQDSVGVLSTIVNAYGEDVIDAEDASNKLFTAVKKGVTSVPELAVGLGKIVPVAASVGVKFGEVSAAVSTMTSIMGKGSTPEVMTGIKGLLNEIAKAGSKADTEFRAIADQGFREFIAGGGDMQGAMELMLQRSEDLGVGVNDLFGSIEAGGAALILAGDGAQKFADDLDANANSAGAAQEAFETMESGTASSINKIRANLAVMKLDFAQRFAPSIDALFTSVLGLLQGTEGAAEEFAGVISTMMGDLIDTVVEVAPMLLKIGAQLVGSLINGFITRIPDILFAAGYLVGFVIGTIQSKLPEVLQSGIDLVGSIIDGMIEKGPDLIKRGGEVIGGFLTWLLDNAFTFVAAGTEILGKIIKGIVDDIPELLAAAGDIINKLVIWFMTNAPDLLGSGEEIILNIVAGMVQAIPAILASIASLLAEIITTIVEHGPEFLAEGRNILTQIWDGMKEIWIELKAWVVGMLAEMQTLILDFWENGDTWTVALVAGLGTIGAAFVIYKTALLAAQGAMLLVNIATAAFNVLMNLNPIGIIITALGLLTAAIVIVIKNWDDIVIALQSAWDKIKEVAGSISGSIKGIVDSIAGFISDVVTTITDSATDIFNSAKGIGLEVLNGFVKGITETAAAVKKKVTDVFDGIVGAVKKLLGVESPSKVFSEIGENTMLGFEAGLEDAKNGTVSVVEEVFEDIIVTAKETAVPAAEAAGEAVAVAVADGVAEGSTFVQDALDGIMAIFEGMDDEIFGIMESVIDTISNGVESFSADTISQIGGVITQIGVSSGNAAVAGAGMVISLVGDIISFFADAEQRAEAFQNSLIDISRDADKQILDNKMASLDAEYNARTERRDADLQAELEAAGLADKTKRQLLDEGLAAAISSGDAEEQKALETAIAKQAIIDNYKAEQLQADEDYAKAKAKIDYDRAVIDKEIAVAQAKIAEQKAISDLGWFNKDKKSQVSAMYAELISAIQSTPLPSYAVGSMDLPRDMVIQAHAGEMVIPKNFSDQLRDAKMSIGPAFRDMQELRAIVDLSLSLKVIMDGREIGRAAYRYTDENVGLTY